MLYQLEDKKPTLEGNNFVADNASVIGSVILKENASVWFNVVIRADNDVITVGENSNIQDGCVLHTDDSIPLTVGRNVTVGHKVMLHGCTIGDNSLVGINSVVMNNAVIGKNCLVGANSLVTESKEFPEGSLIMGAPAKVKRPLTEDEIKSLEHSAQHYVANAQRFQTSLKPIS